ncbi:MAG: DUF371 domain-containing protein [Nitrosopumilaceae archaeon]
MHFEIPFSGHKNIRSLHKNTIEITKDSNLTTSGDCIIGVNAKYGCSEIPQHIKKRLQDPNSKVIFSIIVNDYTFQIKGTGHQDLFFADPNDIVIRKSNYICPRTLAVNCNKASDSIPRKLIQMLQDPKTQGIFSIQVI